MKLIHSNLLNRFWERGIVPIKTEMEKKIATSKIVNNLLTTKAGYVLDARQGKVLQDQVAEINSNITPISIVSQLIYNADDVLIDYATQIGHLVFLHGLVMRQVDVEIQFPVGTNIYPMIQIPCMNYDAWGNKDYQCFVGIAIRGNRIIVDASQFPYHYTIINLIAYV